MSFPIQKRLKRLESQTLAMAVLGAQSLRRLTNAILFMRWTVAGAQTFNLPPATGKGGMYRIYGAITATGNKIIRANGATDVIQGQASITGATPGSFGTAANSNTITMNGSTTGGVIGSVVELWDVAPGQWSVQVNAVGSGVAATCFSNT